MPKLGQKIKQLRKEFGYTLDDLAILTDSSKSYIWEIENRENRSPSAEKLNKIAYELGVTIDYLINDEHGKPHIESAKDTHFYTDYLKMNETTKGKIREMAKIISHNCYNRK